MTSKEIYEYIKSDKVDQLYKKYESCFTVIDKWGDIFIAGDLLDENQLSLALDQSTGVFSKLCPIANALESYMERVLNNEETAYYKTQEKVRTQDTSIGKSQARAKVSDVRDYLSDFRSYLLSAQQNIVSAQSRIKRLTVEKGAKRIDFSGDTSNIPQEQLQNLPKTNQRAW